MSNKKDKTEINRTPSEIRSIARNIVYKEVHQLKKEIQKEEHIRGNWLAFLSCITGLLGIFWQWPQVFVPLSIIQGIFAIDHRSLPLGSLGLILGLTGLFFMLGNMGYF